MESRKFRLENAFSGVLKVLYFVGMSSLVTLALLTTVHVIGRYFFQRPIRGMVELSSLLMLIAISLAGAYAVVKHGHISVHLFISKFSKKIQGTISCVTYSLGFIFTALAAWQTFLRGLYLMQVSQTTEILHIPIPPFTFILSISWALFSLAIALQIIRFFRMATSKESNK